MKRHMLAAIAVLVASTLFAEDRADLNVVHRIRTEAFENSKVMDHLFHLTDVHGPRLTNSPGFRKAGEWTVGRLKEFGMENAKLEKWGPFGRGWSYSRFSAHLIEPGYSPLIGFPLAWTPGTKGPLTAEPIHAPMKEEADLAKYKGKLRGKIVLVDAVREIGLNLAAPARRYSDRELEQLFQAPDAPQRPRSELEREREKARKWAAARNRFLQDEGAVMVVTTGYRGDGGTLFAAAGGDREGKYLDPPPSIAITPEHYNRIVRLLEKKIVVKIEADVAAQFHTETTDSFNVVGELKGSRKKDEIVMLGAHFDSWHGGTGATDNAVGCAVMIEAVRILKSLDIKLDRTVRIGLWGGEEQGLLGSKAYVKEHFADPETMVLNGEHGRLAAYFNYDNGGGKIRGIYLQGNDMVRPLFEAWLAPFKDLGAATISIRDTRGTDHLSFDAVGLPGFQFIQDPLEYETRTHHSNMDVYDRVQAGDLRQASAVVASFVYHAAMRPDPLPRKPLPKPRPKQEQNTETAPTGEGKE